MPPDFGQANDYYLSGRLMFREDRPQAAVAYSSVEMSFLKAVFGQALFRSFLLSLCLIPVIIVTFGLGLVLLPVAWLAPWFMKDDVYGGHWYFSLENQWHVHESAFSLIAQRLNEKRIPAVVTPRLISSGVAETPRYYLSVRQERHVAYISVFTYGADLFVSWTMWREERPIGVLWNWLKESIARIIGKGTAFHEIVRYDPARALRETVHNATRAGVDAASAGETATVAGTFGHELPVEAKSGGAIAPPPVPVANNPQPAATPTPPPPPVISAPVDADGSP